MIAALGGAGQLAGIYPQYQTTPIAGVQGISSDETSAVEKTTPSECQTCKNRKYVDGSNDANVSFKAPGHISPQASAATVMSHEQEHVANARQEGSEEGKQLVSASVRLKYSVCPECGTSYVSGGTTRTTIKYSDTRYDQERKSLEGSLLKGQQIDYIA